MANKSKNANYILSALGVFIIGLLIVIKAGNEHKNKLPLTAPVDFSKKGTVYETEFTTPWNSWGSDVIFGFGAGCEYHHFDSPEAKLNASIDFGTRNDKPIPKEEQQYFKLKVTLTPLGLASNNVEITTFNYLIERVNESTDHYEWFRQNNIRQKKAYKDGEKIEFVIQIPLYGGDNGSGGKTIMIADLQRLRNYRIRVESLEDVKLPKSVKTSFYINEFSTKH